MKQILFVDDEPNFLNGLRRMLHREAHDWDMHFAYSAIEALEKTRGTNFDAVVSDVQMPGMNGLDLLSALHNGERTKNVPVIILTGNAEHDLKRRALDLGAADLLNKPVDPEDLRARLRNTLRMKEFQDAILDQNAYLDRKVLERTRDLEASRIDIVLRLAKAGEFRDEETGDHVMRVAWCSYRLAQRLGLDEARSEDIFVTSPLHDIGKIGIPDGILLKPGQLDEHERQIMKTHCTIGAAILLEKPKGLPPHLMRQDEARENRLLQLGAEIALGHHEKWDGTGYPNGRAGDEIPISAQIVAIADVYDALRSARCYKPEFPQQEATDVVQALSGVHFSAGMIRAFLDCVADIEAVRIQYAE